MNGFRDVKKSEYVRSATVRIGTETKTTKNILEEWRPIKGFEDYSVSSTGRVARTVRAQNNQKPRLLGFVDLKGYRSIALYKDGKQHRVKIHHLVLEAFGSHRPKGYEANHINANRSDNRIENLEWVTSSGNRKHTYKLGRAFMPKRPKLSEEEVKQIRELAKSYTLKQLSTMFNVIPCTIWAIKTRKTWRHVS